MSGETHARDGFVQWNDDFILGIEEIDNQHRRLVELINTLHEAMLQGRAQQVLGDIIEELIDYTATHFATEERYFAEYGYPDLEAHRLEHQAFVRVTRNFQQEFEQGRLLLSRDVIHFLYDWLKNHILGSDQRYGKFLRGRGLSRDSASARRLATSRSTPSSVSTRAR